MKNESHPSPVVLALRRRSADIVRGETAIVAASLASEASLPPTLTLVRRLLGETVSVGRRPAPALDVGLSR